MRHDDTAGARLVRDQRVKSAAAQRHGSISATHATWTALRRDYEQPPGTPNRGDRRPRRGGALRGRFTGADTEGVCRQSMRMAGPDSNRR